MATIAIIGALEKEIMQIKEELSDVCMVQEAGLNVVTGGSTACRLSPRRRVWAR